MNIQELRQKLYEEGCNASMYAIGQRGSASDAYCLTHHGNEWQVYYTERGVDQSPFYTSESEADACQYFFEYIMRFRHDHWVGFFRSERAADELMEKLQVIGLHPRKDAIPYRGKKDLRYRVFVEGREIFPAKELLGKTPIED